MTISCLTVLAAIFFTGDLGVADEAKLTRTRLREDSAPIYERMFAGDMSSVPEGGKRAMRHEFEQMSASRGYLYWAEDLLSDFDEKSENAFYKALSIGIASGRFYGSSDRLGGREHLLDGAYEFYCRKRGEISPALSAELAAAYIFQVDEGGMSNRCREIAGRLATNLWEDATMMMCDKTIANVDALECLNALLIRWNICESEGMLEQMEKHAREIDPWLLEMQRGRVEYRRAWKERGSGYGLTVTRDGWKGFDAHISAAETHFKNAFSLHPEIHDTARRLMSLECPRASSAEQAKWLEAGLKSNPDGYAIRVSHLFHHTSRWGGSVEELERELERIAPSDGDFNTRIPAFNVKLRWDKVSKWECDSRDPDTQELFFRAPDVSKRTLKVIRRYLEDGSSLWKEQISMRDNILGSFACAAYACGDYALAVECWDKLSPTRRDIYEYAKSTQTIVRRLPFLHMRSKDEAAFAALIDAYAKLNAGETMAGVKALMQCAEREAKGGREYGVLTRDIYEALYAAARRGEKSSLNIDMLFGKSSIDETSADTLQGVKRSFDGEIEFKIELKRGNRAGEFAFMACRDPYYGNSTTPVLEVLVNGDSISTYVWENSGSRATSQHKMRSPRKRLVDVRQSQLGSDGIEVKVKFENGHLVYFVNGSCVNSKPIKFAGGGKEEWYQFRFVRYAFDIGKIVLSARDSRKDPSIFDESVFVANAMDNLPPFVAQMKYVPLPNEDYVTNAAVVSALKFGKYVVPERIGIGCGAGVWWDTRFDSSELVAIKNDVGAELRGALTNDIWRVMPKEMREPLALRFAALALQIDDLDLAAEYLYRYVPQENMASDETLAVPDPRYDKSTDPGSNGRAIMGRLREECTPLRAVWTRACAGGAEDARRTFMCRGSYAIGATNDWKLAFKAVGRLTIVPHFGAGIHCNDHSFRINCDDSGKVVAVIYGREYSKPEKKNVLASFRLKPITNPIEIAINENDEYETELEKHGGEIVWTVNGVRIGSISMPEGDFQPSEVYGKVLSATLERL